MTKAFKQTLLALVLGIAMIVIWLRNVQPTTQLQTLPILTTPQKEAENKITEQALQEMIYEPDERDPLLSPLEVSMAGISKESTVPSGPPPDLVVQGMVWGMEQPKCIINGKVYGVGDLVEGIRILDIQKEGVSLMHQGEVFVLRPEGAKSTIQKQ